MAKLSELEYQYKCVTEINKFGSATSADLFKGMVGGADEATQAVQRLLSRLEDMAINSAFENLFGGSLFGESAVGNILSTVFGVGVKARATGGSVNAGQPYLVGEHRAEFFIPDQSGTIRQFAPTAPAAGGTYNYAPVINARGADPAAIARLEANMRANMEAFKATFRDNVARSNADPRLKGSF